MNGWEMKDFIFEISRNIQLTEEQLATFPQQVYIVSKSLDWRLVNSGVSADMFPDFQDKEYVFKTQKKIAEVIEKSKAGLTQQQIQESETAIHYLAELPMLRQAIATKSAQESLMATNEKWQKLSRNRAVKKSNHVIGIVGLLPGLCGTGIGLYTLISYITDSRHYTPMLWFALFFIAISGFALVFSIAGLINKKTIPEYEILKANRESWERQLMNQMDWQKVISTFGDLTSGQLQKIYQERLTFLNPILGVDFQKYLTS